MKFHETNLRAPSAVKIFSEVDPLAAQNPCGLQEGLGYRYRRILWIWQNLSAQQLSHVPKADLVGTDGYASKQGGYRRHLDRLDLAALCDSLYHPARADRQVILEGTCSLEVIARLGISRNSVCSVYVKRLSRKSTIWHDGANSEEIENSDPPPTGIPEPQLSVYQYHTVFDPHRSADFEFRRIDRS